jgi:NADH-quinone oxidoreductase subunit G/NADP-reducing hydrogenase subunit HndD
MINSAGINFISLPDSDFDTVMGESTGASVIFGTSGGVIEAVVRTVSSWIDGEAIEDINFEQLRGQRGIREAVVTIGGERFFIAIAHGLGNARKLLQQIREGKVTYHAIEIMACPNGCVGGGGQPYHGNNFEILRARAAALFREDTDKSVRFSHLNKEVQALYDDYLGEIYGEKAHDLLHTSYHVRELI